MNKIILLLLMGLGLLAVVPVVNGEFCTYYDAFDNTQTMYCSSSCCGDKYYRYCCYWTVGGIAGAAVGSIAGVTIFVIVVVICCRRRRRPIIVGQGVVSPGVTVVNSSSQMSSGMVAQPQVAYPQPPAYGQPQQQYNVPKY